MKNSQDDCLTRNDTPVCPMCKGTGWTFIDDNTVIECDCGLRQRQVLDSKLRFATIPLTYRNVRIEDISTSYYKSKDNAAAMKANIEFVRRYLDNLDENTANGKGLFFWSKTKGSGKTMMATALANELINRYQRNVKFATSLDILDAIKSTYGKRDSEDTEDTLIKDLVNTGYLIIDDFGTERNTDWAGEKFYQIVNKRYINKKVTFYTSNHNLETLKYDDRITNRIKERSFVLSFPEESVREVKAYMDNIKVKEKWLSYENA